MRPPASASTIRIRKEKENRMDEHDEERDVPFIDLGALLQKQIAERRDIERGEITAKLRFYNREDNLRRVWKTVVSTAHDFQPGDLVETIPEIFSTPQSRIPALVLRIGQSGIEVGLIEILFFDPSGHATVKTVHPMLYRRCADQGDPDAPTPPEDDPGCHYFRGD